ncbi:OsmC family protein [Rhizobium sp. SSA_523]|uniref:OsmC family protein n=1 Tax=Rhizobium sp. SSA_523 TaxID=2952477 RepID=UPI002090A410|nr:OsmC family protein [Rhizobium sp. SSA_523]MCO5731614.1 OsmC family protein [Rhizobium sp. SSA_523]WKC21874.1 OsmC family protein [Rhizobium sp. SSA_523]
MVETLVALRSVPGTEAALGWAGGHTVVVDRPDGKSGGMGLGFNGAQLLGLALGGCYCNDLRYAAHDLGLEVGEIAVSVRVELEGSPLMATRAIMSVTCDMKDGSDASAVIDRAWSVCTVANSLRQGIKISLETVEGSKLDQDLARGMRENRSV